MTRVAEVHEPESYAEAAKDAHWRAAMEEEMHALAENETWDLVDVPKEKWRKLDAKAEKCILVGYSDEQKGYKCYNLRTKHARVSRDVVFNE